MTREEFSQPFAQFQAAMNHPMDVVGNTAYFNAVKDAPLNLFLMAMQQVIDSGARFFPKAGELKVLIEQQRQALIRAHPFTNCEMCSKQGWRMVLIDGHQRVARCPCWMAYWQKMEQLGVPGKPVAMLTSGGDDEA